MIHKAVYLFESRMKRGIFSGSSDIVNDYLKTKFFAIKEPVAPESMRIITNIRDWRKIRNLKDFLTLVLNVHNGSHLFPSRAQLRTLNTSVKKSLKFLIFSSISDIFYSILIDSGATNSFVAKNFILKYSLTLTELPEKIPLFILDSNESPALFITHYTKWVVDLLSQALNGTSLS